MIIKDNVSSVNSYINDYYSKLDKIEDHKSDNFYSGSKNYRVTNHGLGKFTIEGTKGYDKIADSYLRKMDRDSDYGYFSKIQVRNFISMLAKNLWNKNKSK